MRSFYIYKNNLQDTIFIKDGFSFAAFFFTFLFTISKGLWCVSLISMCISTLIYIACYLGIISITSLMLIHFIFTLYIGLSYSDWHQAKLKRSGYKMINVIFAQSIIHAKLRFFNKAL
ncbi:DUF2628 domain-containing protein [Neoehrlichia mikurensis]|uniref:DUF2628 domain-containing protein n=1 Tax=Neoehrlichia mikurensis TaxID=89586 RepID=A0A9Q9BY55_9RICK|nr:DUF2628 domain-containing protein [Neoehrlichia mikurensis]QXK92204.1 DUF2628 domain-containing protein [Neoehrlichia mikurensis]QXK92660.1 DUF2628 domain-containing protein [Neoehrlichia mikurensis]QXK93897.1 DUF2628 domain-containing protein [Neoehrlichia mikurensis]UTO55104.1 DUF2628 domain-containing protein [Neoehrlichia mikurensis]UTO56023.1 DUF2628 domain-containing protein [Neoehrlichia mikurensis]